MKEKYTLTERKMLLSCHRLSYFILLFQTLCIQFSLEKYLAYQFKAMFLSFLLQNVIQTIFYQTFSINIFKPFSQIVDKIYQ